MRALAALLMLLASAAAAQDYPALHDVTGVAANDTLNVRAGPGPGHPVIGELAPDATRIEVVRRADGADWGLVNIGERSGWASLAYLRPTQGARAWDDRPSGIASCSGTEPFWSSTRSGGEITISELGTPVLTASVRETVGAVNGPGRATVFGRPDAAAAATGSLLVVPQACNDGMSDRAFGLAAWLLLDRPGAPPALWHGCCTLSD